MDDIKVVYQNYWDDKIQLIYRIYKLVINGYKNNILESIRKYCINSHCGGSTTP